MFATGTTTNFKLQEEKDNLGITSSVSALLKNSTVRTGKVWSLYLSILSSIPYK